MKHAIVVTTINPPTDDMRHLRQVSGEAEMFVVGDAKGPGEYLPGCTFLPLAAQLESGSPLAAEMTQNHYARKNLGYVAAIRAGAEVIYETDDDNRPNEFWQPRTDLAVQAVEPLRPGRWCNVYRHFTDEHVWPRGLSIGETLSWRGAVVGMCEVRSPIQQGLADHHPDVDALHRLLTGARPIKFRRNQPLSLQSGVWAPFNSQSTWWWPEAFPLMYLPSTCSQRMTDIWRGLVAQRCLWETGARLTFHAAEVEQLRNEHNLWHDLEQELWGYLLVPRVVDYLSSISLGSDLKQNMRDCYRVLLNHGVVGSLELRMLDLWFKETGS